MAEPLGHIATETHFLTSIRHNSMPEYGGRGSVETGVREVSNGKIIPNTFRLIQHGWNRYQDAHDFIIKGLAKGWTINRISNVMDYMKTRYKK